MLGYSAPSHSGARVPYEKILRGAWLAVRWTDWTLLDPARLRENLYPAFERTLTHIDGIFNAHCRMVSSETQDVEIPRMVQTVGDKSEPNWRRPPARRSTAACLPPGTGTGHGTACFQA